MPTFFALPAAVPVGVRGRVPRRRARYRTMRSASGGPTAISPSASLSRTCSTRTAHYPHAVERALEATPRGQKDLGAHVRKAGGERSRPRAYDNPPRESSRCVLALPAFRFSPECTVHIELCDASSTAPSTSTYTSLPQLTYPLGAGACPAAGGLPQQPQSMAYAQPQAMGYAQPQPPPGFAPPAMWGQPQRRGDTASHRWTPQVAAMQ